MVKIEAQSIVDDVKEKAVHQHMSDKAIVEGMYVNKTRQISESHQKREARLKQEMEQIHKEIFERKQKHAKEYKKKKEDEKAALENLRERVNKKAQRVKPSLDVLGLHIFVEYEPGT